jgi:hypothetical protein
MLKWVYDFLSFLALTDVLSSSPTVVRVHQFPVIFSTKRVTFSFKFIPSLHYAPPNVLENSEFLQNQGRFLRGQVIAIAPNGNGELPRI